eukprot:contig_35653_g8532
MADYRLLFARHEGAYDTPAYAAARSGVHARCAERCRSLAATQGAVYTKLAQAVASSSPGSFPVEYVSALSSAHDRAAYRPWPQVRAVVEAELGLADVADAFVVFEEVPVAAASLAQVHRAVLAPGVPGPTYVVGGGGGGERGDDADDDRVVAVKVQYPGLARRV